MVERWFGPAEMAERLGVSPKALRVYEREGLVKPLRTEAGWRAYGPDQAARLHQVLALKRLGLPLKRVGELLAGKLASLDAVLALQQQVLETRKGEVEKGLALLAAARAKLARDGVLSPDHLTQLTRETAVEDKMSDEEMARVMQPVVDKHFSADEQKELLANRPYFDQEAVTREWDALIAEGKALMAKGDSGSPEAKDLALRWMAQVGRFTGGDPAVSAKLGAMWKETLADPAKAQRMPMNAELMTFVGEAYRKAQQA